ncbi:hypothetical protein ACO0LM_10520 [Undibacterium sp. Di26W]|uniref:hypothetical protein n=1 Tax=Undibacterium sp. Di26W TaxID=3413035 RepID=UPI003BF21A2D
MKTYRIKAGSFVLDDGSVKYPGEEIELPDDVARTHAALLEAPEDERVASKSDYDTHQ